MTAIMHIKACLAGKTSIFWQLQMKHTKLLAIVVVSLFGGYARAVNNGLAITPQMGWVSMQYKGKPCN